MDYVVILDLINVIDESIKYLCKDVGKVLFNGDSFKFLLLGGYNVDL